MCPCDLRHGMHLERFFPSTYLPQFRDACARGACVQTRVWPVSRMCQAVNQNAAPAALPAVTRSIGHLHYCILHWDDAVVALP
jgi:hypothetical protein